VKGFLEMLDVVAVPFPDPAAFRNLNEADQLDD
jgi:molybdopterin-guanine dinucleotide biosynthesis protein A